MTLGDELRVVAGDLGGVQATVETDGSTRLLRNDRSFAVISADGGSAEYALDPPIAAAAVRTPDTQPSDLGPGWVRFSPGILDDHALDRARAWLAAAHRRASGRGGT